MTTDSDVFELDVHDAVEAFRAALIALIPSAEKVGLSWRPEDTHDDWEELAEAVFEVMVKNPTTQDIRSGQDAYPLARYDFDLTTYEGLSWIEANVTDSTLAHALVFVRFLSVADAFDTTQWAEVRISDGQVVPPDSSSLHAPTSSTRFRLRRRRPGSSGVVHKVHLDD